MKDRIYYIDKKRGFASLIGLLLAMAIIMFMFYIVMNRYIKNPSIDKETKEILEKSDIDTSNYKGILDSSKNKIENINKKSAERNKQYQ